MSRSLLFVAVFSAISIPLSPVFAADASELQSAHQGSSTSIRGQSQGDDASALLAVRKDSWRYDAIGRLIRNHKSNSKNAPPYVLVDKDGKPRCYITPDEGLDIADHVNLRVGVRGSVQAIQGDPLPNILARGVRPVEDTTAATAKPANSEVVAASHAEAAAHQEELPLPSPHPDPAMMGAPETIQHGGEFRQGGGEIVGPGDFAGPPSQVFDDGNMSLQGGGDCGAGCCGHASCPGNGCSACTVCCLANDPGMWWVRAEYLAWATSGMYIPPLVTTGPDADNPGILGEPGTEILFGDETINNGIRSGGRISFGRWLDPCQSWGLGGEYFGLRDESTTFLAASDAEGNPIISRPYFTVFGFNEDGSLKEPGENAELVALPDVVAGSVRVQSSTGFQGAGAWVRYNFCCKNMCWEDCDWCDPCRNPCGGIPGGIRVGMIGGYRFYRLNDSLRITEDLTSLDDDNPGNFLINDRFNTVNQFNGAEVGFVADLRKARWTLELLGKIAVGSNRQTVKIDGSTVITGSDADDGTYEGGLLALPTNIGTYNRSKFNVIPQLNANLGYNVTPKLRVLVGYTLIYWSSVVRAGNQVSLDVNETYIPRAFDEPEGPPRPAFAWRDTDFWAQGVNVGLDYRF